MLTFLRKVIEWVTKSPIVAAVITALVVDLKEEGGNIINTALSAISEVQSKSELTSQEKFTLVKARIVGKFPEVSESLINTSIEAAYRYYKS